jgi:hypothetical protein
MNVPKALRILIRLSAQMIAALSAALRVGMIILTDIMLGLQIELRIMN